MNKNAPFVSIIIPNYNHAQFLNERIQSVLNQTYQNYELIILDDKSSDNSLEIFERYKSNPRVSSIVLNKENSGSPFKQWYKGLELAKGEYIWIAESDDSCDEYFLERMMTGFENDGVVFTFCKSCVYDVSGNKSTYEFQSVFHETFYTTGKDFITKYLVRYNYVANASSVVFRKRAALGVDKQYTQLRGEGDYLFWIELAEKGNVCYINEELNYFRDHTLNSTKKTTQSGINLIEHRIIYDHLVEMGFLTDFRKIVYRIEFVHTIQRKAIPNKEEVLTVWDKYGIYRLLYPVYSSTYRIYSRMKKMMQ